MRFMGARPAAGRDLRACLRVLRRRRRAVEAAETDLVHGHAEAAGVVHLEEGAAAGDDGEHAGHLEVHDAIADLDGLVAHGGEACRWRLAIASDVASLGAGPHNAAMLLGARRFSALAALVARIYGGYKLIQWTRGDGVR